MPNIVELIKRIDSGLDFDNYDQVKMYIQALRKPKDVKRGCEATLNPETGEPYTTQTFRNALTRGTMEELKDGERDVIVSIVKVISDRRLKEKQKAEQAKTTMTDYVKTTTAN